jgi:hypothetical protein
VYNDLFDSGSGSEEELRLWEDRSRACLQELGEWDQMLSLLDVSVQSLSSPNDEAADKTPHALPELLRGLSHLSLTDNTRMTELQTLLKWLHSAGHGSRPAEALRRLEDACPLDLALAFAIARDYSGASKFLSRNCEKFTGVHVLSAAMLQSLTWWSCV